MRKESMILNAICVVAALVFLGLVGLAFYNAGSIRNFLTIDNLFIATVFGFLALVLLATPLLTLKEMRTSRNAPADQPTAVAAQPLMPAQPASRGATSIASSASPAALPPASAARTARATTKRTVPPDVEMMVATMKKSEQGTEQ